MPETDRRPFVGNGYTDLDRLAKELLEHGSYGCTTPDQLRCVIASVLTAQSDTRRQARAEELLHEIRDGALEEAAVAVEALKTGDPDYRAAAFFAAAAAIRALKGAGMKLTTGTGSLRLDTDGMTDEAQIIELWGRGFLLANIILRVTPMEGGHRPMVRMTVDGTSVAGRGIYE